MVLENEQENAAKNSFLQYGKQLIGSTQLYQGQAHAEHC
jgi:hypothetical protein